MGAGALPLPSVSNTVEEGSNTVDLICARCRNIDSLCYVVKAALGKR